MSDQEAPEQRFALGIVWLLVAAVVAAVIGIGIWKARSHPEVAAVSAQATAGRAERIYFQVGQDQLPPEAADVLSRVAKAARADTGAIVFVSGFHDASGNLAANQDLAKRRAQRVRHALEANGVSAQQIVLNKPAQSTGSGDPAEARRVDIRVE